MNKIYLDDTIAAVSTAIGEGGIGIVRLSGKDALKIADKIFLSKNGRKPSSFKTYTVHYGHVVDRNQSTEYREQITEDREQRTEGRGCIIDEVLLTVMRAPRSYTKEDVVEINCHSGIVPLKKILDLVLENGARLAGPGEFTKRAFLNGRIDIAQAEAVLDIIRAKTELGLKAALNNLEGSFSKYVQDIRDNLMDVYAHLEASIDFSEEDLDGATKRNIFIRLNKIRNQMERIAHASNKGRILRQGIKTVLCGSPNVGKSSLMNALLKESRSIVTHIPGTTRDTIEEAINIKGISLNLIDTAGITDTMHLVEKEGIKKAHFYLQKSDLALLVLDYARKLNKNDFDIMSTLKEKEVIIVINKVDLKKSLDIEKVKTFFPKKPMVYVSALNFKGIEKLENIIKDTVWKGKVATSTDFLATANERQLGILHCSLNEVREAMKSYRQKMPVDSISVYLRSAIEGLGEILGWTITEEALDRIFAEFCIGK